MSDLPDCHACGKPLAKVDALMVASKWVDELRTFRDDKYVAIAGVIKDGEEEERMLSCHSCGEPLSRDEVRFYRGHKSE